jgi:hypothetical protein
MDITGCAAIINYFATRPNNTNAVFFEPYGGAINTFANNNAFIHRDAYMDIYVDSFWFKDSDRPAAEKWLDGYVKIFDRYSNGEQYQNYPRRNTPNYPQAFWGAAYPSLQQVKAEYDPYNIFKFPMGIVPASRTAAAARLAKAQANFAPRSKRAPSFESFFEKHKKRQQGS